MPIEPGISHVVNGLKILINFKASTPNLLILIFNLTNILLYLLPHENTFVEHGN